MHMVETTAKLGRLRNKKNNMLLGGSADWDKAN